MNEDKQRQGKKNRQGGKKFEQAVRQDLTKDGWIVSKFTNNVVFYDDDHLVGSLIPAKPQYNPFYKRIVGEGSGFPDFMTFKKDSFGSEYVVIGIEVKTNGYLDKLEKDKCKWLLRNNIFGNIWIASKTKVGRKIKVIYKRFVEA